MSSLRSVALLFGVLLLCLAAPGCDEPRPVQVSVGDHPLPGLYWQPPHDLSPAVLLLTGEGGAKEDWIPLASELRQGGYGVLALELPRQDSPDRHQLLADVCAGFNFLREQKRVDAARIGLLGAGLGADAALDFAAREPLSRLVVLLSPALGERGVLTESVMRDYGFRPLMLSAAEQDPVGSAAVSRLADAAQGDAVARLHGGEAASGTEMLAAFPELTGEILRFLRANL